MPRFTPAASATSRTARLPQPRCGKRRRPAASSAWSRFREGRGGMTITIRLTSYAVKRQFAHGELGQRGARSGHRGAGAGHRGAPRSCPGAPQARRIAVRAGTRRCDSRGAAPRGASRAVGCRAVDVARADRDPSGRCQCRGHLPPARGGPRSGCRGLAAHRPPACGGVALRGKAQPGGAVARHPWNLGLAMAERLMLPQVYASADDAARWRARYKGGLAQLAAEMDRRLENADEVFALDRNNFLLAYQGEDDRELQREYSRILSRLAKRAAPEWRAGRPIRFDGGRRLRVGFVGNIFRDCTAGRYFDPCVPALDPPP